MQVPQTHRTAPLRPRRSTVIWILAGVCERTHMRVRVCACYSLLNGTHSNTCKVPSALPRGRTHTHTHTHSDKWLGPASVPTLQPAPTSRRSLHDSRQFSGYGTDSSVFDSGRIGGPNRGYCRLRETAMYEKTSATVNLANLVPSLSTNHVTPRSLSLTPLLSRSLATSL